MKIWLRSASALLLAVTVAAAQAPQPTVSLDALWQDPSDLESRDLFAGPTNEAVSAPDTSRPVTFTSGDRTGYSEGYDVRDAAGMNWSVKLGKEAQTEVVAARILWAIGYHQLPTYYVKTWTMTGGPGGSPGPARFRPKLIDQQVVGEWSWSDNEFVHTRPFEGLIVANLILNNWDWKTSNNKIYETIVGGVPIRRYVVRDLGASLGKTSTRVLTRWLGTRVAQGSRNDIEDFERQRLIISAAGEDVEFDYKGLYGDVVDTVARADVVWTCRLLARLSDAQWSDAFRAAGYPPDEAGRFITKLKSKIAEGLTLDAGAK